MSLFKKNKNRNKVENPYCSRGLLQQTMMISSANNYDLSVACQAQAYQIVGQQKSAPLQPVGDGCGCIHRIPPFPRGLHFGGLTETRATPRNLFYSRKGLTSL